LQVLQYPDEVAAEELSFGAGGDVAQLEVVVDLLGLGVSTRDGLDVHQLAQVPEELDGCALLIRRDGPPTDPTDVSDGRDDEGAEDIGHVLGVDSTPVVGAVDE
jgi:hypothetical protein